VGGRGRADDPGRAGGGRLSDQGDEDEGHSDGSALGAARARPRRVAGATRRSRNRPGLPDLARHALDGLRLAELAQPGLQADCRERWSCWEPPL
jgi:hypothetical protein